MNSPEPNLNWAVLIRQVVAGSEEAAEELAEDLGALAYKYFRRQGLKHEDSEDLAQDCVVRVIARLRQFKGKNFIGWAFTIMRNQLIDYWRQNNRRMRTLPLLEKDLDVSIVDPSHNGVLSKEEHASIEAALAKLNPDDRNIFESQVSFQKATFEQMGYELGCSTSTARVRYYRAKEKLEIILRKDPLIKAWVARHQH